MGNTDQVWTPTVFTDATGAVTHEVSAASWGSARTVTVVDPTAPSPTVGFSSTIDAASAAGLVHMRARDYDPATGQFLTPDPWVRPDGQPWVAVHSYADGDPVSFWDPDGLRPKHNGCAPKRDGRGGPTGCDVEQWVYTNVCKGPASTVAQLFSWGDLVRDPYCAVKGDHAKSENAHNRARMGVLAEGGIQAALKRFAGVSLKASSKVFLPVGAAATFIDGACQAPAITDAYGGG